MCRIQNILIQNVSYSICVENRTPFTSIKICFRHKYQIVRTITTDTKKMFIVTRYAHTEFFVCSIEGHNHLWCEKIQQMWNKKTRISIQKGKKELCTHVYFCNYI